MIPILQEKKCLVQVSGTGVRSPALSAPNLPLPQVHLGLLPSEENQPHILQNPVSRRRIGQREEEIWINAAWFLFLFLFFCSDPVWGPGDANRESLSKQRQAHAVSHSPSQPGGLLAIRGVSPEHPLSDAQAGLFRRSDKQHLLGFCWWWCWEEGQQMGRRLCPKRHLRPCRGLEVCFCPRLQFSRMQTGCGVWGLARLGVQLSQHEPQVPAGAS